MNYINADELLQRLRGKFDMRQLRLIKKAIAECEKTDIEENK